MSRGLLSCIMRLQSKGVLLSRVPCPGCPNCPVSFSCPGCFYFCIMRVHTEGGGMEGGEGGESVSCVFIPAVSLLSCVIGFHACGVFFPVSCVFMPGVVFIVLCHVFSCLGWFLLSCVHFCVVILCLFIRERYLLLLLSSAPRWPRG